MPNPANESDQNPKSPTRHENERTTKFIVAVHGIGDQTEFGTIKSAAFRFFSYRAAPANIPLGSFHTDKLNDVSAPFLDVPSEAPQMTLRFTEAYWAGVPRDLVKKGFMLEETKRWAQTIVERFRARHDRKWREYEQKRKEDESIVEQTRLTKDDFSRIKQILLEMIESIAILERLLMLAEKAGLFRFNLGKLLDDYIGDVQIVADFQKQRSEILTRFFEVMRAIHEDFSNAEIYIVAHSEGTVVSFLGLLTAMRDGGKDADWVKQVKGLMTIGSPIDKHLLLWPELFEPFEPKNLKKLRVLMESKIKWRNYYDYGDPIGFSLGKTRGWLARNCWTDSFEFDDTHDYEFSRYVLPGKAHTDYWQDKDVFGHFIERVVGVPFEVLSKKEESNEPKTKKPAEALAEKVEFHFGEPKTKKPAMVISYVFPYLLVAALSFAAIFILRKGVLGCISPGADPADAQRVLKSVGLSSLALSGLTAMAGIFRLTRLWRWRFYGAILFVLLMISYWLLQWPGSQARHFVEGLVVGEGKSSTHFDGRALITSALALVSGVLVVLTANWVIKLKPSWGLKPLLVLIGGPVAVLVAGIVRNSPDRDPIWPLLLSGTAAVYLWWLAALLFDLVFIWHYYIRHEAAINCLREPTSNYVKPVPPREAEIKTTR